VWTLADRAVPSVRRAAGTKGCTGRGCLSWMVRTRPPVSVSAQVRRGPAADRTVRLLPGSTKRAAQTSSLPPEGTPVQTSPSGAHTTSTRSATDGAEPTSRRTVKPEGRDPLYGRRRLLAWPPHGHPSSIRADSPICRRVIPATWIRCGRRSRPDTDRALRNGHRGTAVAGRGFARPCTGDPGDRVRLTRPARRESRSAPIPPVRTVVHVTKPPNARTSPLLVTHLLCCRHSPRNLRCVGGRVV